MKRSGFMQRVKIRGFTLIEVLVVISLVGILMAISLTAFYSTRKSARDAKRKADLEQIRSALEMYRSDVGAYPTHTASPNNWFYGNSIFYTRGITTDTYLSVAPSDPVFTNRYYYNSSSANFYNLCSVLELSTTSLTPIPTPIGCGSCGQNCNYKVTNP